MPPKDKKEKPKEAPAGWNFDTVEVVYILIIISALFGTIAPAVMSYISSGEITFFGIRIGVLFKFFADNAWLIRTIGILIAIAAAFFTFVFTKKGDAVWRELRKDLYPENMDPITFGATEERNPLKDKWKKIVEYSESNVESNWRLAIIEADIILADLLEKLGLPGDTIGEKLKAVERSDFITIDSAWEAHKARNMIAHEGQGFLLNQRETRRIISHYEAVFREFYLI